MARKILICLAIPLVVAAVGGAAALADDGIPGVSRPEGETFFPALAPPRGGHIFTAYVLTRTRQLARVT
jgi:hypothetical protein